MRGGMGLEGAAAGVGGFEGIRRWLDDARKLQGIEQANADRDTNAQRQALLDAERTATHALQMQAGTQNLGLQAAAGERAATTFDQGQQDRTRDESEIGALEAQIDADPSLSQIHKLVFKASLRRGGSLPSALMQQPKAPERKPTIAPDGTVIDLADESNIGKRFARPEKPEKPAGPGSLHQVQTVDEDGNPVTKFLGDDEVRGQTFKKPGAGSGAVLPAAMRQAKVDAQVSRQLLTQLDGLFNDSVDPTTGAPIKGAKHFIGPAAGRMQTFMEGMPGAPVNPKFSEFRAATARLKNATIKAITGAAMGVDEAKRIMAELPTENDKPEIWQINAKQSLRNIQMLENAIAMQGGAGRPVPQHEGPASGVQRPGNAAAGGGGQEFDWVPGRGLVPRGGQ